MYNIFIKRMWMEKFRLPSTLVLTMKLTFILLIAAFLQVSAKSYGQNVSLSVRNASLESVFVLLHQQSGYNFLYDTDVLSKTNKVSLSIKNAPFKEALDLCLKHQGVTYSINDKNVVIRKKEQTEIKKLIEDQSVTGMVTDEKGVPLPGVNVQIKGTTTGTTTDTDGKYSIKVPGENNVLVFSFLGFQKQEIPINGKTTINVVLKEKVSDLNEVVVVGYGTMKKSDLTGSVTTVKGDELAKSRTASLTGAVAGRLPGIITKQTSGEPGQDRTSISIRGFGSPLIIVDGVERDFNDLDPEEVESVTVLKDASAAIYGARAGNGVILVTTKRGDNSKSQLNVNSTYTLQGLTKFPSAVNSGQYAELMNEMNVNDGKSPIYTPDEIQKYYDGSDPLNYPNTDWWHLSMNDWSPQQQTEASFRGGSDKVKYFTLLGFLNEQGMYKSGDNKYKRYNVRTNLDASLAKGLTGSVDLSMIVGDIKRPIRPVNNIWQDFYGSLPTFLGVLPDQSKVAYGGTSTVSPIAGTTFDLGGYGARNNNNTNINASINYDIPSIKGLSVKAFGSYLKQSYEYKNWQKNYHVYQYDAASDTYTDKGSSFTTQLGQGYVVNSSFTTQLSASFKRTFSQKHNIDALLLYERIDEKGHNFDAFGKNYITDAIDYLFAAGGEGQTVGGFATEDGRISYVGRLNYNFASKYFFQSTLRYDGSPRFYKSNRWGLFPSVSAAWRLSEEGFLKNKVSWLDDLKLRTSYSKMGYDATGNFQYLSGYALTTGDVGPNIPAGYVVGGVPLQGIHSTGLANPDITWENMKIYNVGLDFNLLNSLVYGELDAFYRERTGMLATRSQSLPVTFGASLPAENLNSQNNRGFELQLGQRHKIGNLNYDISGNISWSRAKWEHYEEPLYTDPDDIRINKRSGNWADRIFAYKSDGLFTSQEEIDNLKFDQDQKGNKTLAPGDIKYVDINHDGKLDWRDQVQIGRSIIPELMFGLNLSANYKGFDFVMLWQGAGKYDVMISPNIMPATDNTPYTLVYNNRWTTKNNNANSLLPRVSAQGNVNNFKNSDFWYVDGTYVRLKNLNIGYTLPSRLIKKTGVQKARIYFSGTNLLTFSKLNKWDYDPEGPSNSRSWYYPQQKTLSLGLSLTL